MSSLNGDITDPGKPVLSIDTCSTRRRTQAYLDAIATVTDVRVRAVGNLHRAYAEHEGAPPGAAIDVIKALGDMVAYNGGAPLTCPAQSPAELPPVNSSGPPDGQRHRP